MTAYKIDVGGVKMKNPVATASGTCGYGEVFASSYPVSALGAVVVKGISLEPRRGNVPPRMAETPCGMLNAIGLENVGLEAFVARKLPWLRESGATVVVNVLGDTAEEYCLLAEKLSRAEGVHGLELNISCPNVKAGGIAFGSAPETAAELVARARQETDLPLWVKLSPNVGDVAQMALAVEEAGADAVSLINTIKGMAIDIESMRPVLGVVTGGLSGPAIKPVALRMVYEVAGAVKIPVVGIGGICGAEDAVEFMLAGASAVQIGTASFIDPRAPINAISGIERYMERKGISDVRDLVGALKV